MFLTRNEIDRNVAWLIQHGSAPVRFLTQRHILDLDPALPEMKGCWKEALQSPEAQELFSRQFEDGTWFSGGPWGSRGYQRQTGKGYTTSRPKFVTTAWLLPFLGEMGFTVDDERIRKSCDAILAEKDHNNTVPTSQNTCGLSAIPLRAFASVGMGEDDRLQNQWKWIRQCQRDDGGWLNPHHLADSANPSTTKGRWPWDRSCVWGSYYAAQAFFYLDPKSHESHDACEFLLWHLKQQDPAQLKTWVYHGHNIVKELLMFSESDIDMTIEPIPQLLDWIKTHYLSDEGVFRSVNNPTPNYVRQVSTITKQYEKEFGPDYWKIVSKTGKNVLRYHLYHLIEDDWLTYTLTRIGKKLLSL